MNKFSIFSIQNQYHMTQDFTKVNKSDIKTNFKDICNYLEQNNITCIYCKIFINDNTVLQDLYDELKEIGQKPIIIPIENKSVTGSVMSGISLYGILKDEIESIEYCNEFEQKSICYKYKGIKFLHGMRIFKDSLNAFNSCELSMSKFNLTPKSLIRTWFYLDKIFQNYADFNKKRNTFFDKNGIKYDKSSNDLPASTCIEGSYLGDHIIQLYASDLADNKAIKKRIYNISQNEADGDEYLFQPAFSRAMLLKYENYNELQISGTASIGSDGKTLHIDDEYEQLKTTLRNVSNLLREANMNWEDICECTMFFTSVELYNRFEEACDELNINKPTGVSVISYVCRDNLLFELDGIAKKMLD